jgi:hypothetical protein
MSSAACALVQLTIAISIEPNTKDSTFFTSSRKQQDFCTKKQRIQRIIPKNTPKNQIF